MTVQARFARKTSRFVVPWNVIYGELGCSTKTSRNLVSRSLAATAASVRKWLACGGAMCTLVGDRSGPERLDGRAGLKLAGDVRMRASCTASVSR